jgi:hypothetical protein
MLGLRNEIGNVIMLENTRTLYRPVGLAEMQLVLEEEPHVFPSRKPEQPFFYPVLAEEYAHQIARDWNTKDDTSGHAGFVTQFHVDINYLGQFEEKTVGGLNHKELWIPADDLPQFNQHIRGNIDVISAYYGDKYEGARHEFRGFAADGMCNHLYELVLKNKHDFRAEMMLSRRAIYLNYAYWMTQAYDEIPPDRLKVFLQYLADAWRERFPNWHLPYSEKVDNL